MILKRFAFVLFAVVAIAGISGTFDTKKADAAYTEAAFLPIKPCEVVLEPFPVKVYNWTQPVALLEPNDLDANTASVLQANIDALSKRMDVSDSRIAAVSTAQDETRAQLARMEAMLVKMSGPPQPLAAPVQTGGCGQSGFFSADATGCSSMQGEAQTRWHIGDRVRAIRGGKGGCQ